MNTKTGQFIVKSDLGIMMKKQHTVTVVLVRAGDHQGEWRVIETAGGLNGYPISTTHFATEAEATEHADALLAKTPDGYYSADEAILNHGTRMASKFAGTDMYGKSFSAGTPIVYYKGEIILQ